MIKKISILGVTALLLGIFAVTAATPVTPSKSKKTQQYAVANFDKVKVSRMINVEYEQTNNNNWSVEVTAPENILPYVKVYRKGTSLMMTVDNGLSTTNGFDIKAKVKSPVIKEVDLNGASSFKAGKVNLAGQELELESSGASVIEIKDVIAGSLEIDVKGASSLNIGSTQSAKIEIDASGASVVGLKGVKSSNVEVEASGASSIELSGKTEYAEYEVSGASVLSAGSLSVNNGKIKATGASSAKVNISNVLMQHSSGASSIKNEK